MGRVHEGGQPRVLALAHKLAGSLVRTGELGSAVPRQVTAQVGIAAVDAAGEAEAVPEDWDWARAVPARAASAVMAEMSIL